MQIVAKTCGILDCDVCSMMNSVHGIKPFQLLWYNSHPYNAPIYQQIQSILIPWSLGKQSFNLWNLVQSSCRPISAITLFNTKFKVGKLSYWYFSSKSISKPLIGFNLEMCILSNNFVARHHIIRAMTILLQGGQLLKTNINCIEGQSGAKIISGLSHLFSTHCNKK